MTLEIYVYHQQSVVYVSMKAISILYECIQWVSTNHLPLSAALTALLQYWKWNSPAFPTIYATRKQPGDGPNARIAPQEEYCAVTRALRSAARQPGQPIFYPHEGLTFNSCEEAREYYNLYSWEIGFGIRYGRNHTNIKGYTTRQDLVCSCGVWN